MKQFFFFLLLSSIAFSQSRKGFIYQKNTSVPIAFATINIADSYEIISDKDGEFIVPINNFKDIDTLKVSRVGYKTKSFLLKEWQKDTLFLQENEEELNKFFVLNEKLSGNEIMKRVSQNLNNNYPSNYSQFLVFQRIKTNSEILDIEIHVKKANFLSQEEIEAINLKLDTLKIISKNVQIPTVQESIYQIEKFENDKDIKWKIIECMEHAREEKAEKVVKLIKEIGDSYFAKLDTTSVFKLKSGFFLVKDSLSLSDNLLQDSDSIESCVKEITDYMLTVKNYDVIKNYKAYKFDISKIQKIEGEPVYVLTFYPNSYAAKYAGTLHVSADTYAITRLDYDYAQGKYEYVNLKFLMGLKYQKPENRSFVIYKKKGDYYFPIYGRFNTKSEAYVNRNFKLLEENKNQNKRDISKIKIKLQMSNSEVTEYIFKIPNNL